MRVQDVLKQIEISSAVKASSVFIVKSNDPIKIYDLYASLVSIPDRKTYVFRDALYEIKKNTNGEIESMDKVSVGGALASTEIRELPVALSYMKDVFINRSNIDLIVVITDEYGNQLLPQKNIVSKYLYDWQSGFTYIKGNEPVNMYTNNNRVIIITPEPNKLFHTEVIDIVTLINMEYTDIDEREDYIRNFVETIKKKYGIELSENDIKRLATISGGLTLYDIETAVIIATKECVKNNNCGITVYVDSILKKKREVIEKFGFLELRNDNVSFNDVGGYNEVKEIIKEFIVLPLLDRERAHKLGVELPRGILFYGPPGTGKTLLARAIANEIKLPFIDFKLEMLLSKWYGESERNIVRAIELIEQVSPAVVFIDEIDRIGRKGRGDHEVTQRIFGTLLQWLGDINRKSIVIATTNRPDLIDDAFIRVGRFDYIIPILYPDEDARKEILKVHIRKRNIPTSDDIDKYIEMIARETTYYSGAELEEIIRRASRYALIEGSDVLTGEHLVQAMNSMIIDLKSREEQLSMYMELAKRYTNDVMILRKIFSGFPTVEFE